MMILLGSILRERDAILKKHAEGSLINIPMNIFLILTLKYLDDSNASAISR